MSTPNGFDERLIEVINTILYERESDVRITDIHGDLWDAFMGPMVDQIEDGYGADYAEDSK